MTVVTTTAIEERVRGTILDTRVLMQDRTLGTGYTLVGFCTKTRETGWIAGGLFTDLSFFIGDCVGRAYCNTLAIGSGVELWCTPETLLSLYTLLAVLHTGEAPFCRQVVILAIMTGRGTKAVYWLCRVEHTGGTVVQTGTHTATWGTKMAFL